MNKLWQKNISQNLIAEKYCSGDDVVLDNALIKYDVLGSIAHAQALVKLKILSDKECLKIIENLKAILILVDAGKFSIEFGDEDVHTKVENYLVQKLGKLGKKIHTARSRNDQVLVDIRLYSKDQLFKVAFNTLNLAKEFNSYAKKYEFVPMPGYTHMQKAMPSSIGMWSASFAESLLDDMQQVVSAFKLNDQSPLGSGAAYGLSLPIDRSLTAKLLGFQKVQNNSLYSQVSRPKIQLMIMQSLTQIMLTLSRFAEDLLLFTTSEYNFFSVAPELCTGSSIMPQKKNLDIMEHLRAKTHLVIGYEQIVASISAGLPSGYNADFIETKPLFMKSFETVLSSVEMAIMTLKSVEPNIDTLKKAMTPELFATHAAYELVKNNTPFREAYLKIGKSLNNLPKYDVLSLIKHSNHIGGTGNLNLISVKKTIKVQEKEWKQTNQTYKNIINALIA